MASRKYATMDGNTAAAYVAYPFTEIASIYPITPSSPMAELTDAWSAAGRRNMFGSPARLVEMQSEAGAIAAAHGALQTGSLAVSYTSSQGLMLMIPVLHRISGEHLPCVLHVASRTVGTHAMSIFGDHSDVMNCRQCGFAMLCTSSVQEVMDLAGIAHLAAVRARIPFIHFFDGFRTSHELDKVELMDLDRLEALLDRKALADFRASALNPEHPQIRGTVQNSDIYFQVREASEPDYRALPGIVEDLMDGIASITGRRYHAFDYHGVPDARHVVIAMGSVCGALRDAVDHLNARGEKTGMVQVHLFRPFSASLLLAAIPPSVRGIAVLDRCKEPGSAGEPLFQDVCTALAVSGRHTAVIGGRYGLSSKDVSPGQLAAVFAELASPEPRNGFTLGIEDDVCGSSLKTEDCVPEPEGMKSCIFWGLGSDGTVGANKNSVEIINSSTDLWAQAYFEFDAKKSFGLTRSHLRIAETPVRSSHLVRHADFVACHNPVYAGMYAMDEELKDGGSFLINCPWTDAEFFRKMPRRLLDGLRGRHARIFAIDATSIASELGLHGHTNVILQAAFFRITGIVKLDLVTELLEKAVEKTYRSKGPDVVEANRAAIRAGMQGVREISLAGMPADAGAVEQESAENVPETVSALLRPINALRGDSLPVSAFLSRRDGRMDPGMTAWEKRDIAIRVPAWDASSCIQCGKCALACPHAAVRTFVLTAAERGGAPASVRAVPARGKGLENCFWSVQIDAPDCTGCGCCVASCPAGGKALAMVPRADSDSDPEAWNFMLGTSPKNDLLPPYTIRGSQLRRPLLEFSAACAGCGETPYAKLLTQLYGPRVYWANATGCSQAWGSAMPGIPYTVDERGRGPAWSNSLFENNAEFSLGMLLSVRRRRSALKDSVERFLASAQDGPVAGAARAWLETFDDDDASGPASDRFRDELAPLAGTPAADEVLKDADLLPKQCFWMFGGDGWAYDIGFGGLDHVLASGEDINVFIVDTEVYSNTGGQSSKATPAGAVAKFCASGKKTAKKDLGAIFMSYGTVYVASVCLGADPAQLLRALREAAAYKGPSLVIAYAPCISHGIRGGMGRVMEEMKRAVQSGYWPLYRYNPGAEHPLTLDSEGNSLAYRDFLEGENRYSGLLHAFPEEAERLFRKGEDAAKRRFAMYRALGGRLEN